MTIPNNILNQFPTLSPTTYEHRLARPRRGARVIIDTDTANEIDDQYALTWVLLSPDRLTLQGVTAVPFSFVHHRDNLITNYDKLKDNMANADDSFMGGFGNWEKRLVQQNIDPRDLLFTDVTQGAELSYQEILRVFDKCHMESHNKVFRGSPTYLPDFNSPVDSESAHFIIEQARASDPDDPLYILAMGAATNIASALLMAPDIIEKIVVVWTSAFPSYAPFHNGASLNLVQDIPASQILFASGVPHVYLPGYHVGAQLKISLPEMERFVQGQGNIGNYLHHLYTHNPLHTLFAITNTETKTWVIWDIINVAWMLSGDYVSDFITQSPILGDDTLWQYPSQSHPMREAYDINRDAIFEDFYQCLQRHASHL